MFPTTLDMKNAKRKQKKYENSMKNKITYFNTSVVINRRKDNH